MSEQIIQGGSIPLRKLMIVLSMLFVFGVLVACSNSDSGNGESGGSTGDEKQIVMKIGHTMVDNSTRNAGAEKIKEYVEEKSEGRIKVDIYPNSQLGSSKEQVEGVQTGSIEMAIFPSTSVADFQPIFTMMDIPFLIPTEQEKILKLYETDAFKELMATGDDVGIKVLATWYEGLGTIASKESIETPDDFKKLKFRIIGGEISHEHYASLGADIDVIAFNEVYTSLQTGRINTIDIPIHQLYDNKFYEVVENVTKTSHWSLHDFVMVNKDWFDSLPADLQEVIT